MEPRPEEDPSPSDSKRTLKNLAHILGRPKLQLIKIVAKKLNVDDLAHLGPKTGLDKVPNLAPWGPAANNLADYRDTLQAGNLCSQARFLFGSKRKSEATISGGRTRGLHRSPSGEKLRRPSVSAAMETKER